jgi:two-component system sensor histidine kinase UhpB
MIALNTDIDTPDYPIRILHLEDSEADHRLTCRALERSNIDFKIDRVDSLADFCCKAAESRYDVILADYRLPGFTAIDAWHALPSQPAPPPFILLSGAIGESAAVSAIHLGISDFLHKNELERLGRAIRRTLEVAHARAASAQASVELAASEKRLAQFASHLQAAVERERAAIAREIHDDIGGSLAAVKLDLGWISRHSTELAMRSHVDSATEMLQHALGASQRIMMNLRPSILDQGLAAAIQWLASGFERRTGIKTVVRVSNEQLSLDKEVELTAYRTAQEALTNILKYAQCTQVEIDLSDAGEVLTIEISDNGKGIQAGERQNPSAFGIRGLTERARLVGGWLDVSTSGGVGTSITLSIPLSPDEAYSLKGLDCD